MKIISPGPGRVSRVFVGDEIQAKEQIYAPELYRLATDRYGFVGAPSLADSAQDAKFQHGRVVLGNKTLVIRSLSIFRDGLVVEASNTEEAELVLENIVNWLWDTFEIARPITQPITFYMSQVVVIFDSPIHKLTDFFYDFIKLYGKTMQDTYHREIDIHFARLSFSADPLILPQNFPSEFNLERRIGRSYSENRFFSTAPVRTKAHIALLEAFEKAAAR